MRAFMLEVPEELLAERRRKGADRWDEVWNGVLHMVPAPSRWHQHFGGELYFRIKPAAEKVGLMAAYETSVYRPDKGERDYRTPDLVVYHPRYGSKRGVEGVAELVVEILSPDDETHDKLPFYVEVGVKEILVLDPDTRAVELYVPTGGRPTRVAPATDGSVRVAALDMTFTPLAGPKLGLGWDGGTAEI
jgi:Uma2 family endonuclease